MMTTKDLGLEKPLYIASKIMDAQALDDFRAKYQQFRGGESVGAKGEMKHLVMAEFKSQVEEAAKESFARNRLQKKTTYDLAKDVPIDATINSGSKYEARFERTKLMRSDVLVESNLVENLASRALGVIPEQCHRSSIYVVTDSVADDLYGQAVLDGLVSAGLQATKFVVPSETDESGETSTEEIKTLSTLSKLADMILDAGVDKRSCIVSVGGGVVNNICGYLAGSIYRGITLVHFSTTFMGQVDAAIDFKQAVNHGCGKNLLGCYYPASKILLDPTVLLTQSKRHRLNGLAEALKHGMVHSTDLLEFIVNGGTIADPKYLDGVVRRTIAVKVPTLTRYEESDFNEMAPQFGHAPAHAIEFLSWHGGCPEHGPLLHGEAVAIGMCVSAEVAYMMGVCTKEVVEDHYRIVESVGLPSCTPDEMDLEAIIAKFAYDKHTLSGKPTMGLLRAMGDMYEVAGVYGQPIEPEILREAFLINMARGKANKEAKQINAN